MQDAVILSGAIATLAIPMFMGVYRIGQLVARLDALEQALESLQAEVHELRGAVHGRKH
jgi:hypothetical protein